VDLLSDDRDAPAPDVFRYQWVATERYCAELSGEGTEAAHLSGIVRATGEAHRTSEVQVVAPALLAYALYLEQESHLQEAEDALLTLLCVGGNRLGVSDATAAWLRLGRVRRLQADFPRAAIAYAEAGRAAAAVGDQSSVLLSRIGQCNVLYFQGNLAAAEQEWRSVLADAVGGGYRNAEAYAEHGLGTVLQRRGQPHEGAPHLWRAYELYDDVASQLRALGDLGSLLMTLGDLEAAEAALREVVRRGAAGETVSNAIIELMHSASFRRDRVGFERWRERSLEHLEGMVPNVRADYHLKVGIGLARFGSYVKAETHVRHALEIASAHGLHELVFRIERIGHGLRECGTPDHVEGTAAEPAQWSEALREVAASLAALSG
jgi:tetratricopeptide (TPR) repeat protein